jgi:hypothetical protein
MMNGRGSKWTPTAIWNASSKYSREAQPAGKPFAGCLFLLARTIGYGRLLVW